MTVLVLGATGQVGSHLQSLLPDAVHWRRADADLEDPAEVRRAVLALAPQIIVNASAYTAVDRAESDAATAWLVNAAGVAALARAAADLGAALIHLSTDYVFDGTREAAYAAGDPVSPLGVYGRTKLAGELAVQSLCPRSWIIRTSWVFSEHGSNFVKTMLRLAAERDTLRVVSDQHGRPSYAGDVARLVAELAARIGTGAAPAPGTYHAGGGPATSWYDFAERIFARAAAGGHIGTAPRVEPIPTRDYPTPARRPMNAVLEPSEAFQAALGVTLDWRTGLDDMLSRLAAEGVGK